MEQLTLPLAVIVCILSATAHIWLYMASKRMKEEARLRLKPFAEESQKLVSEADEILRGLLNQRADLAKRIAPLQDLETKTLKQLFEFDKSLRAAVAVAKYANIRKH